MRPKFLKQLPLALLCTFIGQAQTPMSTTPLNVLWRLQPGTYMSSIDPTERSEYPSSGAVFYIPKNSSAGTSPLYRLYLPSNGDHMDSSYPGDGTGYNTEGILGYPWNTPDALPGLRQLIRLDNGTFHVTTSSTDPAPGYNVVDGYGNPAGYTAWGFSRPFTATEALLSLNAGGVTIESNGVTGGCLWTWTWNGTQFISHQDYGQEIQSSVGYPSTASATNQNPTEAGDNYGGPTISPDQRHGSPVIALYNNGFTQISKSIPLDFGPDNFGGGPNNPVLYQNLQLGKEITLNYQNLGPVAQYVTTFTTPMALNNAQIEIPTGYVQANLNRYYTYDPQSQSLTDVTSSVGSAGVDSYAHYTFVPSSGYGGVIVADSSGSNAMAAYGVLTSSGGSVSYFTLWNFISAASTSKWDVVHGPDTIAAGDNRYTSYIMTGTLAQVQGYMNSLYAMGAK